MKAQFTAAPVCFIENRLKERYTSCLAWTDQLLAQSIVSVLTSLNDTTIPTVTRISSGVSASSCAAKGALFLFKRYDAGNSFLSYLKSVSDPDKGLE